MIATVVLLAALAVAGLWIRNRILGWRHDQIEAVKREAARLDETRKEKIREVHAAKKELDELEQRLELVRRGIAERQARQEAPLSGEDKAADWLLSKGRISLEQFEKARAFAVKNDVGVLSALSVLGYITSETHAKIKARLKKAKAGA